MKQPIIEMCPHCGEDVEMNWDVKKDGYKAFCPYCGNRLMLCDECMHPDGEYNGGYCDYDRKTDTCQHNSETKPAGIDRLLERNGDMIHRVCHYPEFQDGCAPCFGCVKRTECNRNIIERLCEYEDLGLSPEEVGDLKKRSLRFVKCKACKNGRATEGECK